MKTLRNTSIITLAVVALALLVAAPMAKADTVQVIGNAYTPTNYSPVALGSFNLFDSNLGTLNSVTLTFSGGVNGTIQFTNLGTDASNVSGHDNGTLILTSTSADLSLLFASPLNVTTGTVTDTLLPGIASTPLNTGPVHPVSGLATTAGMAVNPIDFSIFEAAGGGTTAANLFSLSATGSSTVSANNGDGFAAYTTSAGGAVKIDYNYSGNPPPGVPEPGTLSLFGTGLLGLAGMLRQKFAK